MLHQVNIVSIHQELKFQVSSSLHVKVQVQKIVLEGGVELLPQTTTRLPLASKELNEDVQPSSPLACSSPPSSSSVFSTLMSPLKTIMGAIIDDIGKEPLHPPVATLSTDTLVMIAPYENKISSVNNQNGDHHSEYDGKFIEKVTTLMLNRHTRHQNGGGGGVW